MSLRKTAASVLMVLIIAAGGYSFYSLDYPSKANPVKVIKAIQSFATDSGTVTQRPPGPKTGQTMPAGSKPGPEPGKGENGSQGLINTAAFFGVFASTATLTYGIDCFIRKRKALR